LLARCGRLAACAERERKVDTQTHFGAAVAPLPHRVERGGQVTDRRRFSEPGEAMSAPSSQVPLVEHDVWQRAFGIARQRSIGGVQRAKRLVPLAKRRERFAFGRIQPSE
jgi:hypothetical protein